MSCAVRGCKSNSYKKQKNDVYLSYHRFPENFKYKIKWLEAINKQGCNHKKYDNRRICSKHFTEDSFVNKDDTKWRRLKPEAIPTLLLSQRKQILESDCMQSIENLCPIISQAQKPIVPPPDTTFVSNNISIEVNVTTNTNPETVQQVPTLLIQDSELPRVKAELTRTKTRLARMSEIAERRRRKIEALKQKNRRMQSKNICYKTLLETLLKNQDTDREQLLILERLKSNEIIRRLLEKSQGDALPRQYSLEFKKFAITLHLLSPQAYDFVRDEFENVLPHPKTISSWYKVIDK